MSSPGVCVTVSAATMAELRRRRDGARGADLVELRLDAVSDPDVAGALAGRQTPVLVTCRPAWEGGLFRGSEEERRRLLEAAVDGGAEFVDLEWRAGFEDLIRARGGRGIVLSTHDFTGVPADLRERVGAMARTGAEVIKVAVQAARLGDSVPLLGLRELAPSLVVVAMGTAGLPSRVLAARFGSRWTYAGDRAEVGQITPERLAREFRFRDLGTATEVFGVVGRPIGHSISPAMHNAALSACGIDAVYLPLEAADPDDFLQFADAMSVRGASVTAPYKQAFVERVEARDAMVERIGALNTLRRGRQGWEGRNTDVSGFLAALAGRLDLQGTRAALLGTGGAARAVAAALADRGARVAVHGRDPARAASVASLAGGSVHGLPPAAGSWDLLVNATPVGTYPAVDATPLAEEHLDGPVVYDLVYNPTWTRLLREARAAGCETIGGLDMLVAQAAEQFTWWTGRDAPAAVMREAAERRLEETRGPADRSTTP